MLSRLVCGRHISTDGGLVLAAEFIKESIENGELNGASMHINVPKKSVDQGLSEDPQISEKQSMRRAGQTENNRKEQALRKAIADSDATEFGRIIARLGDDVRKRMIVHAVHTTNLAAYYDPSTGRDLRRRSKASLILEMKKARKMGISTLVFHLGSNAEEDEADVMQEAAVSIRKVLAEVPGMTLAIENMTHHCHGETSRSLDDLRQLIDDIGAEDGRVKICIDLCHLFVDQYDLFSPSGREEFFASLDRLGMNNVAAIHVSDSGEVHGGTKDCHMNGLIGLEAFRVILRDERLRDVLLIFETPDYFRGNRQAGSKRGQLIAHLENERHAAEESLVRKIVTLTDEEWYQEQASHTLWEKYKKKKVSCEGKIYKLLAKENGAMFENLHNRRAGSISRASKVRAMKSERAKKLVEANGEWVPTIARAPRHLEVEPAKDLGSLLLRSGKRCE